MSKRRKGFPSETGVKRGDRIVRGTKELSEKLGRNEEALALFGKVIELAPDSPEGRSAREDRGAVGGPIVHDNDRGCKAKGLPGNLPDGNCLVVCGDHHCESGHVSPSLR